jgi:hypothetical protein
MKFYKAKHAEIGEGVEATVLFHKDNGDELICVHSDADSFEKQNPKAKVCSTLEADKLVQKAKIRLAVPRKKELRKTQKLTDDDILKEVEDEKTPTVSILKSEDEEGQTLTYMEEVEVASAEEFLKAQKQQSAELEPEIIEEVPQETVI